MTLTFSSFQFADGQQQWCGLPDSLDGHFESGWSGCVWTLVLGADGGLFCKWEDGSYTWEGIPIGLHDKLNGQQKSLSDVDEVMMGQHN